jgi:hypothetical protein
MRTTFFCLIFCAIFLGCRKEATSDSNTSESIRTITLITSSAVPGDFVYAQADFKPNVDTARIQVADKMVTAMATDSNMIFFIMPEFPAGTSAIVNFKNIGVDKNFVINVGDYIPITHPDEILNQYNSKVDSVLANLVRFETSSFIQLDNRYSEVIKYVRDAAAAKFASLTTLEQKELAYVLRNEMLDETQFKLDTLNPNFYARTEGLNIDPLAQLTNSATKFFTSSTRAKLKIPLGGLILRSGNPLMALLGAYLIYDGIVYLIEATGEVDNMSNTIAINVPDRDITAQRVMADSLKLVSNIVSNVVFKGTFRTLIQSDASSLQPFFQQIFKTKNVYDEMYRMTLGLYDKISNLLGSGPAFPSTIHQFRTQAIFKQIPLPGEMLSISNISNPNIQLAYTPSGGSLNIKATSSSIKENTPFSFDVTYHHPTVGTSVSQKINAVYKIPENDTLKLLMSKTWTLASPAASIITLCCGSHPNLLSAVLNFSFSNNEGVGTETISGFSGNCPGPAPCKTAGTNVEETHSYSITAVENRNIIALSSPLSPPQTTYIGFILLDSKIVSINNTQLILNSKFFGNLVFNGQ